MCFALTAMHMHSMLPHPSLVMVSVKYTALLMTLWHRLMK